MKQAPGWWRVDALPIWRLKPIDGRQNKMLGVLKSVHIRKL